uniref:Uncharacterized protein n=1 Tax=Arundo donax TaxID=35708 RepID=A0A0A9HE19_ARUDO
MRCSFEACSMSATHFVADTTEAF